MNGLTVPGTLERNTLERHKYCLYIFGKARELGSRTGSTHLSPEEFSCTSPASWLRWLPGVLSQPDTPWARPTCPSCWARRGPNSQPSARWLFAGYLRRCSHLLVIGVQQAFLCNRTWSIRRSYYLRRSRSRFASIPIRAVCSHVSSTHARSFVSWTTLLALPLHSRERVISSRRCVQD